MVFFLHIKIAEIQRADSVIPLKNMTAQGEIQFGCFDYQIINIS